MNENKSPKKKRYEFIDLMKGTCIILVVIQHLVGQCALNPPWLTTFRMPMYFMLSGIFFSTYNSFPIFLLKKFNSLLVPFFMMVVIATGYIYCNYGHWPKSLDQIIRTNVAIWFLLGLFEVGILYYVISKIPSERIKAIVVMCISFFGYMLFQWGISLPYYLDTSMTAIIFYYLGSLFRKMGLMDRPKKEWIDPLAAIACTIVFGFMAYIYSDALLDLRLNRILTPYPVFLLSAISGSGAVFFVCKLIRYETLLSYWGRYSIVTLCFHLVIYRLLQDFFSLQDPWAGVLLVMLISIPFIWFATRHFPFFCSQMPLIDPQTRKPYLTWRQMLLIIIKGKKAVRIG